MVTRIYTPPVMSYYRAQQLQNPPEQPAGQESAQQAVTKEAQTKAAQQRETLPGENTSSKDNLSRPSAGLASLRDNNVIHMDTILDDFQNTLNALGADEQTRQEVTAYLGVVTIQAEKDRPDSGFIRHTLKTAAGTMDSFISETLKQPSNVVKDWVDALLLQPIDFHLGQSTPGQADKAAASITTSQAVGNASDALGASNNNTKAAQQIRQALKDSKQLYTNGDTQAAIVQLESLAGGLDPDSPKALSGRVHLQLGKLLNEEHRYSEASPYLRQAVNAFEAAGLLDKQAQAGVELAQSLEMQGQWEPAKAEYTQTLLLSNNGAALPSQTELAARNGLANVYLQQGDTPKALEQYLSAYQLAQQTPDAAAEMPDILSNLGQIYYRQSNLQKSEQAYRLALKYAKREGDLASYRATLGQLANLYDASRQDEQYQRVMSRINSLPTGTV